jgi:sortase A
MDSILKGRGEKPQDPTRKRLFRRAEYILLAIGFLCIGIYVYSLAESGFWQSYDEYRLEASMRGTPPSVVGYLWHVANGFGAAKTANREEENAYRDLPGKLPRIYRTPPPYGIIGRIEVPRLNVSAVVREGVDAKTLRRAAGHVPGTALPGDEGNVAVAAHRDTFFRGLRDIKASDRIRMVTPDGTFEYVVRSTKIVKPHNVEVLDPTDGKRELTLITCYPFNYVGNAPDRFIVKAEEASVDGTPAVFPPSASAAKPSAAVVPAVAEKLVADKATPSASAVKSKAKASRKASAKRVPQNRRPRTAGTRARNEVLGW